MMVMYVVNDNLVIIKINGQAYGPKDHFSRPCLFPMVSNQVVTGIVMKLSRTGNNIEQLKNFRTVKSQFPSDNRRRSESR